MKLGRSRDIGLLQVLLILLASIRECVEITLCDYDLFLPPLGQPPTEDAEQEWFRMERDRLRRRQILIER